MRDNRGIRITTRYEYLMGRWGEDVLFFFWFFFFSNYPPKAVEQTDPLKPNDFKIFMIIFARKLKIIIVVSAPKGIIEESGS